MLEKLTLLNPGVRSQLIAIYDEFSKRDGFPMDYCEEVAGGAVSRVNRNLDQHLRNNHQG